jgi:hypothetical protein
LTPASFQDVIGEGADDHGRGGRAPRDRREPRFGLPSHSFRGTFPFHETPARRRFSDHCRAPLHAVYEKEHIVVSGGVSLYQWEKFKNPPHDCWWGNFIRPAVTRFQQIRDDDPNARITWLVHRPSYERRLRQNEGPLTTGIANLAPKYNVRRSKGSDLTL